MSILKDPFDVLTIESAADTFSALGGDAASGPGADVAASVAAMTTRFHGFELEDRPPLTAVDAVPNETVPARSAVPLLRGHVGATVVVLFENGNSNRPIIVGVLQDGAAAAPDARAPCVSADVADDRVVLTAEREIVLRCGDASITLTRAGKVVIKGK